MLQTKWDVVILGGGFAGLACAKRLEKLWGEEAAQRVLLVSAENYFLFQPFLPEVIEASIEPRHVTNPIRFVLRHCSLSRAEVSKIHPDTRRVEFDSTNARFVEPIEGQHLVLALGSFVCTIGNAPNPVLSELGAEYEEGKLLTDEWLRVKGHENVWAIGDGAANPDGFGQRCPPTAQFATPLGRQAANNIAATLIKAPLRPFRYKMRGQMATIGHHKGVCSIFGFRFSNFFAWWLTRTVHLLKLPGIDRKFRVMIDWTFELFFPPDLNYFDLKKTQKMARIHLEPGDEVFHQGERGKAFYIVEDGVLEATRCHADGHILWKDELVRGDHFGEGSLLHGLVRRVTVTAKAPTTLVVFASKEFEVFVGLFQSLGQLLNYSATRGPLEEVLKPAIWSEELLNSPVGNLRNTAIACISDSATIAEAVQKLAEISQGFLLVVDRAGKLTGLVTGTDLHRASANRLKFSETVKSVASSEVVALQTHQVIRDALRIFYMKKVKQAPVLNAEGRPVGILRYLDVALARIQGAGGSHPGKG